jgi:hypothetical protein
MGRRVFLTQSSSAPYSSIFFADAIRPFIIPLYTPVMKYI